MSYSKLHSSIVNSSLWTQDDSTRLLFITLLAVADRDGCVYGSKVGLARIANIEPDDIDKAFLMLLSPDPESCDLIRAPENEGRRIEEIPGGFRLLNHEYYRGLRNEDDRREQNRIAQEKWRKRNKPTSAKESLGNPQKAHTDTDTDTDTEDLNPPTPLSGETQTATLELGKHSAAKGLGEMIGMNHSGYNLHSLVSAIEQGKRRWPDLRNEEIAVKIKELWDEYTAQGTHIKVSLKSWLDSVGRFIDKDDWRVKKPSEAPIELDWQGGHFEGKTYVNKNGQRLDNYTPPPAPRGWKKEAKA